MTLCPRAEFLRVRMDRRKNGRPEGNSRLRRELGMLKDPSWASRAWILLSEKQQNSHLGARWPSGKQRLTPAWPPESSGAKAGNTLFWAWGRRNVLLLSPDSSQLSLTLCSSCPCHRADLGLQQAPFTQQSWWPPWSRNSPVCWWH